MNDEAKLGARLLQDARGLTTVEYAIVLCLIAVLGIGTWNTFGTKLRARIDHASSKIEKLGK